MIFLHRRVLTPLLCRSMAEGKVTKLKQDLAAATIERQELLVSPVRVCGLGAQTPLSSC